MSKVCEVCGKHPVAARSISHSHRVTNRMQYPNIQNVFIVENGERRKAKVCTKCLKAGKVVRG
jgi:large subunit ribosomal protein L28